MTNDDLAHHLRTRASELARSGKNIYRVRAFRQAAFTIMGLTTPAETITREQWARMPGIGNRLAEQLERYVKCGEWVACSPPTVVASVGAEIFESATPTIPA
jgi:holliday junction DNA helicase RuvA